MPSHYSPVAVAAAVLWLSLAAPGTGTTTTGAGAVGPPLPSPSSECQRWCGHVYIPYPFGAGPDDSCSASPELRLHCKDTGNGVQKLFLISWADDDGDIVEVLGIDVRQGQMRVVSQISSSCFINDSATRESTLGSVQLPEPYRFSSASNKLTVLGCLTQTYMLGVDLDDYDDDDDRRYSVAAAGCVADCRGDSLKPIPTDRSGSSSCTAEMGCCQSPIQGDEDLRSYHVAFQNHVNITEFNTTYPCAHAVLMDSSYRFNFSTSYLAPNNEFNRFRVPVVLDWLWVRNQTCRAAAARTGTDPAGYACVSDHSKCVDAAGRRRGYLCQCAEGFEGNPYIRDPEHGCKDIDECKDNRTYPCYGICNNTVGTYDCHCPEGTKGNASRIGECFNIAEPSPVRLVIGIPAGVFFAVIAFLAIQVLLHKRRMKRQALFQHNGGQLLKHMLKVEGNDSFTIYSRGDILIATRNFHKTKVVGEGAHGTVYKVTLDVGGRASAVAVKRCKAIDESRKKEFVQELVILCHLSHPNIVKLVGCCLEFEAPTLVYEFAQNGNLDHLLHGKPRRRVSLPTRLRIAAESAEALAHLHTHPVHPVLHGDVKPENILLADGLIAKVSDFGCSTIKDNVQVVPKGTLAYLDPEFLRSFQLTDKGDVYSFGVVLVELLTRKKPRSSSEEEKNVVWRFQESMRQGTLHDLLDKDIVLEESSMVVIQQVAELGSRCLAVPSTMRPSMEQVAQELRLLKDQVVVECPQELEDDLGPMEMEMTTGYPTAQTLSEAVPSGP